MSRDNNYYGLFNNNINFRTDMIETWWKYHDTEKDEKKVYTILEDYNINIKKIISNIMNRKETKYNSFPLEEMVQCVSQYLVLMSDPNFTGALHVSPINVEYLT